MTTDRFYFPNNVTYGNKIDQPPTELIKNTLGLWNASVEDALKYGGDITRAAIGAMNLRNDRKNVIVDVKVHMLMKGQCPAIPGWHTDGVPRHPNGSPAGGFPPDLKRQRDDRELTAPRYHLLVTGEHCLTEYVPFPMTMNIPQGMQSSSDLYAWMTEEVNTELAEHFTQGKSFPSCQVTEWDWWTIHQGTIATGFEWRYLIRATETDYLEPERDLRNVLRTQQNVYVPMKFGW